MAVSKTFLKQIKTQNKEDFFLTFKKYFLLHMLLQLQNQDFWNIYENS